jgi:hypothetical protein
MPGRREDAKQSLDRAGKDQKAYRANQIFGGHFRFSSRLEAADVGTIGPFPLLCQLEKWRLVQKDRVYFLRIGCVFRAAISCYGAFR